MKKYNRIVVPSMLLLFGMGIIYLLGGCAGSNQVGQPLPVSNGGNKRIINWENNQLHFVRESALKSPMTFYGLGIGKDEDSATARILSKYKAVSDLSQSIKIYILATREVISEASGSTAPEIDRLKALVLKHSQVNLLSVHLEIYDSILENGCYYFACLAKKSKREYLDEYAKYRHDPEAVSLLFSGMRSLVNEIDDNYEKKLNEMYDSIQVNYRKMDSWHEIGE